jgi:hypothetical protein
MVRAHLESQGTTFHAVGFDVLIFTFFYLESCIWHDAISGWIRLGVCIKFCANLGRRAAETLAMIRIVRGRKHEMYTSV